MGDKSDGTIIQQNVRTDPAGKIGHGAREEPPGSEIISPSPGAVSAGTFVNLSLDMRWVGSRSLYSHSNASPTVTCPLRHCSDASVHEGRLDKC